MECSHGLMYSGWGFMEGYVIWEAEGAHPRVKDGG